MKGDCMWCLIRWLAAFWLASLLASPAVAQPELAKDIGIREANPGAKFLALVIGVSNYGNAQVKARGTAAPVPIPSLPGPREDAQDIASLVRQMGFVISNENQMFDLDRAAMQREISRFVSQLDEQTVALVYYSGHGLENQNENYLVPRSANLESVDDLRGQLVSLNEMLRDMGNRRAKARIVILDACRNFPDLEGGTKSLGDTGGFSEVKIGAGLRLVYAAEPGQRALPARARERNSVFTSALLSAVREPALGTFDQVIHRAGEITQELTRRSDGSSFQQPWIAGSAGMTFRLRPTQIPPRPTDEVRQQQELKRWQGWQARMKSDFDTAAAERSGGDIQVRAWERFLQMWGENNPLSNDDEALRSQAETRLQEASRAARAATESAHVPVTPTAITNFAQSPFKYLRWVDYFGKDLLKGLPGTLLRGPEYLNLTRWIDSISLDQPNRRLAYVLDNDAGGDLVIIDPKSGIRRIKSYFTGSSTKTYFSPSGEYILVADVTSAAVFRGSDGLEVMKFSTSNVKWEMGVANSVIESALFESNSKDRKYYIFHRTNVETGQRSEAFRLAAPKSTGSMLDKTIISYCRSNSDGSAWFMRPESFALVHKGTTRASLPIRDSSSWQYELCRSGRVFAERSTGTEYLDITTSELRVNPSIDFEGLGKGHALTISPDGRHVFGVAQGEGGFRGIAVWDLSTGRRVWVSPLSSKSKSEYMPTARALEPKFTKDGGHLAFIHPRSGLSLLDLRSYQIVSESGLMETGFVTTSGAGVVTTEGVFSLPLN